MPHSLAICQRSFNVNPFTQPRRFTPSSRIPHRPPSRLSLSAHAHLQFLCRSMQAADAHQKQQPPSRALSSPSLPSSSSSSAANASYSHSRDPSGGLTGFTPTTSQQQLVGLHAVTAISSPGRASPGASATGHILLDANNSNSNNNLSSYGSSTSGGLAGNATLGAGGRKNSTDDLAAEKSTPPSCTTISEARLLYRNWRTGSHVGADFSHVHDSSPTTDALSASGTSPSQSSDMSEVYVRLLICVVLFEETLVMHFFTYTHVRCGILCSIVAAMCRRS